MLHLSNSAGGELAGLVQDVFRNCELAHVVGSTGRCLNRANQSGSSRPSAFARATVVTWTRSNMAVGELSHWHPRPLPTSRWFKKRLQRIDLLKVSIRILDASHRNLEGEVQDHAAAELSFRCRRSMMSRVYTTEGGQKPMPQPKWFRESARKLATPGIFEWFPLRFRNTHSEGDEAGLLL